MSDNKDFFKTQTDSSRVKAAIEEKYEKEIKDIPQGIVGETKVCEVKTRVNQNVLRQIVLANYDGKCTFL